MSEKEINKVLKPNYVLLVASIAVVIVGVLLFCYGIKEDKELLPSKEKTPFYASLIADNKGSEIIQYVKVNIVYIEKFAYKDELDYYFAIDNDNLLYILRITDKTYDDIKKVYEQDKDNFSYEIFGWTHKIEYDVKKLAIESINNFYDSDFKLTNDNYKMYLGESYLDETLSPNSNMKTFCTGGGMCLIIISIVFFIIWIVQASKTRKSLRNYDVNELDYELRSSNTSAYKKEQIYLTPKYIISTLNGLKVLNYQDIYWLYNEQRRYNGANIGTYLNARLTNKKLVSIAYSLRKPEILVEIMDKVLLKYDKVLIGFTDENKKKFKEYKNEK